MVALVAGFLAVQVVVPALGLLGERPTRFGWQMFSSVRSDADFVIVDRSGQERAAEITDYLGKPRGEIDLAAVLPAYICDEEPDAHAVRIVPRDGGEPTTVACS